MFAVLAALTSSLAYGISDFFAAIASRKLPSLQVTVLSYTAATVVAGIGVVFWPGEWSFDAVMVGAAAGALAAVGFWAMYAALGIGPVSVVAPLIAVVYAAVPVAWALFTGTVLSGLAWAGIAVGLLAVLALSVHPDNSADPDNSGDSQPTRLTPLSLTLSIIAALTLGFAVVVLDLAPHDSGLTSAFVELLAGLVLLSIAFVFAKRPARDTVDWPSVGNSLIAGALLGVANASLVLALIAGELAVVGILSSLYPLATIVLAAVVLRERVSRIQMVGIALALAAAVMLGIG